MSNVLNFPFCPLPQDNKSDRAEETQRRFWKRFKNNPRAFDKRNQTYQERHKRVMGPSRDTIVFFDGLYWSIEHKNYSTYHW